MKWRPMSFREWWLRLTTRNSGPRATGVTRYPPAPSQGGHGTGDTIGPYDTVGPYNTVGAPSRGTGSYSDGSILPRQTVTRGAVDPGGLQTVDLGPNPPNGQDFQLLPPTSAALAGIARAAQGGSFLGGSAALGSGKVQVRGAALRGWKRKGAPNGQDAILMVASGGRLLIAAADGLGQYEDSHHVSQHVLAVLDDAFQREPPGTPLTDTLLMLVEYTRAYIRDYAQRGIGYIGGSTLVAALIEESTAGVPSAPHTAAVAAVGDSACLLLRESQWVPVLSDAIPGKEETRFLPKHGVEESVCELLLRKGDVLVMATDGLHEAIGNGNSPLGDHLRVAWASPPRALEFANDLDFRLQGYGDDRAAVAVWL